MNIDPQRMRAATEAAFEAVCEKLAEDGALLAEFERSRPEFSEHAAESTLEVGRERRLREWFLLERPSEALGAVPVEAWAGELDASHDGIESLLASSCAVYEVLAAGADRALCVRDLLTRAEHVLDEPEAALELQPGDLVVGRIFPTRDGAATLSAAAIWMRDASLLAALQRDLGTLRNARRGMLRISQAELERMFFATASSIAAAAARKEPSAALRAIQLKLAEFLAKAGLDEEEVADWLAELAETPLAERGALPGADDVLGRLLAELAMRSDVDLELARALVLTAWQAADQLATTVEPAVVPSDEEESAAPEAADARRAERWPTADALAAFDRERAAGAELEAAFQLLERRLGITDAEDDEPAADAVEAPSVLAVLVAEYAWEREHSGSALKREHQHWLDQLAHANATLPGLEDLDARLLVQFAAGHAIRNGTLRTPAEAAQLCDVLRAFALWCESAQDHPLQAQAAAALDALQPELERVVRVNHELEASESNHPAGRSAAPSTAPAAVVIAIESPDRLELAEPRGKRRVQLSHAVPGLLRVGDWVQYAPERAGDRDARQSLLRVYPEQAAAALGH
jgi:hypothetical protein